MYQVTSAMATATHDDNYRNASRATTFIICLDTMAEKLSKMRRAELFFRDIAKADDLLKMPTMLIKRDDGNRILAKSPLNIWVDITQASPEEVELISIGAINPLHPDPMVEVLGAMAGLQLVERRVQH